MLFNPTGGITYHVRAYRHRHSLWLPFRQQVSRLLDQWNPPERKIAILGPSAGYTLPVDFLQRFDRLWLFDPDPLAPWLFRQNHPDVAAEWSNRDLIFAERKYSAKRLLDWLDGMPDTALLFANVLGQLPLLNANLEALRDWWQDMSSGLGQRSWFSYHDLFSFDGHEGLPTRLPEGEVVPQLVNWAKERRRSLDLVDHGTSELFERPIAHVVWRFTPRRTHVIEAAAQDGISAPI